MRTVRVRTFLTRSWPGFAISLGLVFLYGPILLIGVMSFNDSTVPTFPLRGLTVRWYRELLDDERFLETAVFSVKVAVVSTLLAVVLGTAAAIGISRARSLVSTVTGSLYILPLLIPALVLAVAMAVTFRLFEVRLSFWTVTAGHVVFNAPVIFLLVSARLRGFDWSLVQAARVLGATPRQAFLRITMPLLLPAILGGAVLSFALSLDNFVGSLFLTGSDSTIPLLVWSMMREGFSPSVNALATLLVIVTLGAALTAQRLFELRRPSAVAGQ
jgi:spermidine/putrescine transport system permease protein